MSTMYRIVFVIIFVIPSLPVQSMMLELDDVLEDYRKTLPPYPERKASDEETAFQATQFIFQFIEKEKGIKLEQSLRTIDLSFREESLMDCMMFHTYYNDSQGIRMFKDARDQQIGSIYKSFLKSLVKKSPVVGYVYYHGFKSAYIYDSETGKGKVISRNVDLQERVNYETYKHLQGGLRRLGIDFHFVVLRDTFHALTFKLDPSDKIYKDAPEICQYGIDIQKISNETDIMTLDFCDLKNIKGKQFDVFIENNLETIINNAKRVPQEKANKVNDFLKKEYEYEDSYSNDEKENRAMERARRYFAILDFMRKHEGAFLLPTLMQRFGDNLTVVPFSTHVENHIKLCKKIPLRNLRSCLWRL